MLGIPQKPKNGVMSFYDGDFFEGNATYKDNKLNGSALVFQDNCIFLLNYKDDQLKGWQHCVSYKGLPLASKCQVDDLTVAALITYDKEGDFCAFNLFDQYMGQREKDREALRLTLFEEISEFIQSDIKTDYKNKLAL